MKKDEILLGDKSLKEIRELGFPYWDYEEQELIKYFNELVLLNENKILENNYIKTSKSFNKLASNFFPYMFETRVMGMKTPLEGWNNDKLLQRAITIAKKFSKNPTMSTLRSKLMIVSGVQCVSNFRPDVAKLIYNKFGSNGKVYDFSMGYGGRLVGFLSSNCLEYVGVDVNSKNFSGYDKINKLFNTNNKIIKLLNIPSENFSLYENYFDLAFSSPPYFCKEIYSEEENQSCNKYPEYNNWLKEYWLKTVNNIYNSLKINSYFCLNIARVNIKGKIYNLDEDCKNICLNKGFVLKDVFFYSLKKTIGTRNSFNDKSIDYKKEPLYIFQKI